MVQPTRCTCYFKLFILVKLSTCFCLSVHHQELKTAYTATVFIKQLLLPTAIGDEMELEFYLTAIGDEMELEFYLTAIGDEMELEFHLIPDSSR
jgi:hypothetical protein